MRVNTSPRRQVSRAVSAVFALLLALPAAAQDRPTLNMFGTTGLIDTPSAEEQPDGTVSLTVSNFGPITRTTLSFQITPRLSGSFRYLGVADWNKTAACQPNCTGIDSFATYYDRSFDIRYKLLDEGRYLPAFTIGLQDFVGTGIIAGEYVVATKHVTPDIKVSAGLGWGRLGSYGDIGSPFGVRPAVNIGNGGTFNPGQWFRGPAAPFAGVEWQINDRLTAKAEYSSDAYAEEAGNRKTFDRKS
ncbi:MAG: YjbH domain-containing protein, partial [Paracoccaceae bacterium]